MNYLIWANSYLAIFYGFYWFFLRKETFFQLNRAYLLSGILLSFILPLLDLKGYLFPADSIQFFYTLGFDAQVNQVVVPSVSAWSNWMDFISGISIIVLIYGLGCVFALIKLFYRLVLIKRHFKSFYPGQAYSFFNKVHIDPQLIGYSTIIEHENIHVKQFHSLDILFVELIKIVNWFNPVVYLLHRSVKLNHEYIADDIVARSNHDRSDYAQILMCQVLGAPIHSVANNFFNQSFTKKRIAMLFKNKSRKVVLSRFFLLIPIMLVFIAFQAKEPVRASVQVSDISEKLANEASQSSPVMATQSDSLIFAAVEASPVPVDGMPAFLKYIGTNYVYPKEAEEAKVKGRLVLTFVVEKDGSLSNIQSVRDLGYGTGEEAIRVLKSSPKWKPGVQNGQLVRVQYTLPIVLNLDSEPK